MNTSGCTNITQFDTSNPQQNGYNLLPKALIVLAGVLLSILTLLGNCLVLMAYKRNKRLQTVTNLFLLSLSVSDIIVGVVSINLYTVYFAMQSWPLGPIVCDMYLCVDYVVCQVSVNHLLLICFDRYKSLANPLVYRTKRTARRAKTIIFIAWLFSIMQWAPWIISYQFFVGYRTVPEDSCYVQFIYENWYMSYLTAILAYYLPVLIIIAIYVKVYSIVQKRSKEIQELTGKEEAGKSRTCTVIALQLMKMFTLRASITRSVSFVKRKRFSTYGHCEETQHDKKCGLIRQKKAAKMLTVICLAFTITWLPYHVLVTLAPFCPKCIPDSLWDFSYMLCYVNSTINPLCYALCNVEFRRTFKRIIKCTVNRTRSQSKSGMVNDGYVESPVPTPFQMFHKVISYPAVIWGEKSLFRQ